MPQHTPETLSSSSGSSAGCWTVWEFISIYIVFRARKKNGGKNNMTKSNIMIVLWLDLARPNHTILVMTVNVCPIALLVVLEGLQLSS